ncbi:unnamed protein product [Symbiodinium sp. CCMP2592]|nr:unnamed protein product [Symbiodinium sp. CCMP2592]
MALSEPNPFLALSEKAAEQASPMRALLEGSGIPESLWKDVAVFAPDEFGSLSDAEIQEFLDGLTYPAQPSDLLVKARIRLLWRKCQKSGAPLQPDPPKPNPVGSTGALADQASWSEAFPKRLSGEAVRQMIKAFSEKYPSEPLRSPLAMDTVEAPRLENLLWEEIPSRELPTQGMAKSVMAELLHLQAVAIALADGAHLYTLREMNRKFLVKCFDHLPRDGGLRVPNRLEAENAEKQLWQQIAVLFNEENWTMDQAIREVVVARNELHVLLMPRAVAPKIPWQPWTPHRIKGDGKQGNHGKGGKGDKGNKGGSKDGKGSQRHTLMINGLRVGSALATFSEVPPGPAAVDAPSPVLNATCAAVADPSSAVSAACDTILNILQSVDWPPCHTARAVLQPRDNDDLASSEGSMNLNVSVGDFQGGALWLESATGTLWRQPPGSQHWIKGEEVQTFRNPISFPACAWHETMPFVGNRWSITCYTLPHVPEGTLAKLGFPEVSPAQVPDVSPIQASAATSAVSSTAPISALPPVVATQQRPLFFLDLFAGAGAPLCQEAARRGWACIPIDILHNKESDLRDDRIFDGLLKLSHSGAVAFANASPPCCEYSIVKQFDGGFPACSYGSSYANYWAFATTWRPLQQLQSTCQHAAGHHAAFHGKRDATGQFVSRHTAVFPPMLCNAFMEAISPLFPENSHATDFTSLNQALSALPVRPLNDFPTGQQDGGGIYSQPDWTSPPAGSKDNFRQLRQDMWGFFKEHKLFDRLRKHVSESSQEPLIQQHELPALRSIWEDWFRAQGFTDSVSWEVAPDQPYCLQALELLSKALDDRDVELWKDLQAGVPTGVDGDISMSNCAWQQLADTLTDDLHFRKSPPGSTIPPGSKLLSARHVEIKCKADLRLVRATGKRVWIRVADASSSKRRISTVSRQFIMFWVHFCMRPQMPRCLSLPPLDFQYSLAADACAKGNDIGIGGWVELPNQPIVWFSEWFTVQDFRSLGLPMKDDANLDITAYETLAQLALLIAFISITPTGRLRVCIPSWSDNSGTESLTNKLFTVHTPLCFFAQKLATRSWQSGISLDCTHIAGCHNDKADFLSRWKGDLQELPSRFTLDHRVRCPLTVLWEGERDVRVFPPQANLLWQPPVSSFNAHSV